MANPPYPSRGPSWLYALLLVLVTILAYSPAWHAGFIWDDDAHLTANPCIVGPLGFSAIWATSAATYYPMVLTTFSMVHALFGLHPLPYHLLNLLFHVANALLLWRVLEALDIRGAWLGAALWALHPVMVESVAWITELKNTQSCFFYLLSILCFLQFHERVDSARWRPLLWALLCFVLAITSKTSTVMLPLVLALCVWWIDRRWSWYHQLFLIPFFLVSFTASAWTIWEQKFNSLAIGREWMQPWSERIALAGWDIWFYLGKLLWPDPLVFIYPRWEINPAHPWVYLPTAAALLGLVILWLNRGQDLRPVFFAAVYFVLLLFPVLSFFDVYFYRYSFVSDHFQYLASIGPLALAGAAIASVPRHFPAFRALIVPASTCLLLLLAGLSWKQSCMYVTEETLYRATLSSNPSCWLAHNNLGTLLLEQDHVDEAEQQFNLALQAKPDYVEAHYNLGDTLLRKGAVEQAMLHYQSAIAINPASSVAHNNLGNVLLQLNRPEEAIPHYEAALKARPNYAEAHNNFGNALFKSNRVNEAQAQYLAALKDQPHYAEAHYNLAILLSSKARLRDALDQFQQALQARPNYAEAYLEMGNIYLQDEQVDQAIEAYRKAWQINPHLIAAGYNLAWLLATIPESRLRNGPEAIELAEQVNRERAGADPMVLAILAAAYAEGQRFPEAIDTAVRGAQIARDSGNASLAEVLETYAALYRQGQPFRMALPAKANTP